MEASALLNTIKYEMMPGAEAAVCNFTTSVFQEWLYGVLPAGAMGYGENSFENSAL